MWNVEFKMKFKNACTAAIILSAFLSTNSFAQTLADAHKAYVTGNWQEAAPTYEVSCPKEPDSARAECYLWDILALSQTGNAKLFKVAGHRLDSLINTTSPERPVYSEMLLTKAQFMLYMGKNARAAEILIQAIDNLIDPAGNGGVLSNTAQNRRSHDKSDKDHSARRGALPSLPALASDPEPEREGSGPGAGPKRRGDVPGGVFPTLQGLPGQKRISLPEIRLSGGVYPL